MPTVGGGALGGKACLGRGLPRSPPTSAHSSWDRFCSPCTSKPTSLPHCLAHGPAALAHLLPPSATSALRQARKLVFTTVDRAVSYYEANRGLYELTGRVYASGNMGVPQALTLVTNDTGDTTGRYKGVCALCTCTGRRIERGPLCTCTGRCIEGGCEAT